jgi:hypothetical protein
VVINKVARTPQKYPRRPGMPGKRPLLDAKSSSSTPASASQTF